jgi:hypothetical protein
MKKFTRYLPALLIYMLVYSRALTFIYIEGDDATSIAYHLLGRNPAVQPPYSIYQGMMDALLSILPASEPLIRYTAFGLSSLACLVFFVLLMELVFEWHPISDRTVQILLPAILLLAGPELIYMGLSFMPTLLAMCFLLGAHLLVRRLAFGEITTLRGKTQLVLSLILFGLGVAFRWNTIVYGAVIVVDAFLAVQADRRKKIIPALIGWGLAALVASIAACLLSNLNTLDLSLAFARVTSVWSQMGTETSNGLLSIALILSPLLTPVMVLLAGIGFIQLIRVKNPLWVVVLVGLAGILPWLPTGTPKNLITGLPGLFLCAAVGFDAIWNQIRLPKYRRAFRSALVMVLIGPWLLGLQVEKGDTAWGPGYEQKPFDRPVSEGLRVRPVFGSGSAFPTPEGPRPIYGYLDNLIGGKFREFVLNNAAERDAVINAARAQRLPIVVTNWSPDYYLADLYALGYFTTDGSSHPADFAADLVYRGYMAVDQAPVDLYYREMIDPNTEDAVAALSPLLATGDRVALTGYSGTLRTLYLYCPAALSALGNTSAVVDLRMLSDGRCPTP